MKTLKFATLLGLVLLLSLPLTVFAQDDLTETYSNGGYSFQYPAGWQFQDLFGLLIGSNDAVLLEGSLDVLTGDQAVVIITPATLAELEIAEGDSITDVLEAAQASMLSGEDAPTIGKVSEIELGGRPAAQVEVADSEIQALMVALNYDGEYLIFLGGTAVGNLENYQATFLSILETLTYDASQAVDFSDFGSSSVTLDVANAPQPVAGEGNFVWQTQAPNQYDTSSFGTPYGVSIASDDTIYVADGYNGILVLNGEGVVQKVIQNNELFGYEDVAVAADGTLWVANSYDSEVVQLDAEGNILTRFGSEGTEPGQFGSFSPRNVEIGSDGNIYTFDTQSAEDGTSTGRIQVFTPTGELVVSFPTQKPDDFGFTFDIHLAITPDGNIVAADSFALRIFDAQGNIVADAVAEEALGFNSIYGMTVDPEGNIYVITSEAKVLKLDSSGAVVAEVAGKTQEYTDTAPPFAIGEFYSPYALGLFSNGDILVADTNFSHVQFVRVTFQ